MRRYLVLFGIAALFGAALFTGCGGSDSSSTEDTSAVTATEDTSSDEAATEAKLEEVEVETKEVELEAAEAKKEAAEEAAKARQAAAKQAQKAKAAANAEAQEAEASQEAETPSEAPNVVGMKLPEAKAELIMAGFSVSAVNTDTAFGIIDPSNYTICSQDMIGESVIKVLAQKYGC